jgi:3,4-dihydroxy-2-butanone 4-phosphate synthase
MEAQLQTHITQHELARRWGRAEAAIALASAAGVGPQFLKINGQIVYPHDEVQRYERACLFFEPAEVALRDFH